MKTFSKNNILIWISSTKTFILISFLPVSSMFVLLLSIFPKFPPTIKFLTNYTTSYTPSSYNFRNCIIWGKNPKLEDRMIGYLVELAGIPTVFSLKNSTKSTSRLHIRPKLIGSHQTSSSAYILFNNIKQFERLKSNIITSEDQKHNFIPGIVQALNWKTNQWKNWKKMIDKYGIHEFNHLPESFVMPKDKSKFLEHWRISKKIWIVKPKANSFSKGIQLLTPRNTSSDVENLPKNVLVQKYIDKIYTDNNKKVEFKVHVLITSLEPLRIYINKKFEIFTAIENYTSSEDSFNNFRIHIRIPINQAHKYEVPIETINIDVKSKLFNSTVDSKIWVNIENFVIKSIISVYDTLIKNINKANLNRYNCYQLLTFDYVLDSDLKPWLMEINTSPFMGRLPEFNYLKSVDEQNFSNSGPKNRYKMVLKLQEQMLNLLGFHLPIHPTCIPREVLQFNKLLYNLSSSDSSEFGSMDSIYAIIQNLTETEVYKLAQYEDETHRLDLYNMDWERIYPVPNNRKPEMKNEFYLKYIRNKNTDENFS